MKKRTSLFLVLTGMFVLFANGYSMHIMEGFLPKQWLKKFKVSQKEVYVKK